MYRASKRHFISGITGSGKTTYATWEYERVSPFAVFVNTNSEVQPEKVSQIVIHNVEDIIEAYNEGYRKICYSPTSDKDIEKEDVENLCDALIQIGAEINRGRQHPFIWCYLYIDEIQDYSSKFQPSKIIDRIWKRGRRYGIVGIAISQRPADVSHTILTQSSIHIIFKLGIYEKKYFDTYHIPIFDEKEDYIDWLNRDYHFIVFTGENMIKAKPIKP